MRKMHLLRGLLISFVFLLVMAVPLHSRAASRDAVEDSAGILSEKEIQAIQNRADEIYAETGVECYVLTMRRGMDGDDLEKYSERYIEAKTNKGALLIIDMVSRAYHLDGYNVPYMSYYMNRIEDAVESRLRAGDYAGGCLAFMAQVKQIAENGKPSLSEFAGSRLPIFAAISLVIAGIVTLGMVKAMKPVAKAVSARSYLVKDSFRLRSHREYFLYRNVSRSAKAKSSGSSGGGHSHGGGHF